MNSITLITDNYFDELNNICNRIISEIDTWFSNNDFVTNHNKANALNLLLKNFKALLL